MCLFFLSVVVFVVCTRVLSSFLGFIFQSAEFLLPPLGLFRIVLGFWKLCLSDSEGNVLSNSALA
jgi:cadmium resistance protein CadD (predicted permease)